MDQIAAILKGADELHINTDVFFIKDKKAYYADGRPVEQDKLRVCQHCQTHPTFVATKTLDKRTGVTMSAEMVFAKHMVEKHPEHAKPKKEPSKKVPPKKTAKKTTKKATPKKKAKKATKKKGK